MIKTKLLPLHLSSEHRPPLPPPRKSEEKLTPRATVTKSEEEKPKPVERRAVATSNVTEEATVVNRPDLEADDPWKTGGDKLNATGSSASVASSMDDTPMLQKLKDMNKK